MGPHLQRCLALRTLTQLWWGNVSSTTGLTGRAGGGGRVSSRVWQGLSAHRVFADDQTLAWATLSGLSRHWRRTHAHLLNVGLPPQQRGWIVDRTPVVLRELTDALATCTDATCSANIFDAASEEIFKLMERDTFSRFKSDPQAISQLVDGYYKSANKEGRGNVSYADFRAWAVDEPSLLVVFTGLCNTVQRLLKDAQSKRAPPPEQKSVMLDA